MKKLNNIKLGYLFILTIVFTLVSFAAEVSFEFFEANSSGDDVRIEWKLEDESDVKNYIIQRWFKSSDTYKLVSIINCEKNNQSYSYLDENNFSKPETGLNADNLRRYRIQVNFDSGKFQYSNEVYVTHNVSSVKKTWGMLKEMFR